MRIRLLKGQGRSILSCIRPDGSRTQAEVGPGLPGHDLAHFVAETGLGLSGGFFGLVAQGRSIAELADPRRVSGDRSELAVAEVVAGALQATASGACWPEQLVDLVTQALGPAGTRVTSKLSEPGVVRRLVQRLASLLVRWTALREGEALVLTFQTGGRPAAELRLPQAHRRGSPVNNGIAGDPERSARDDRRGRTPAERGELARTSTRPQTGRSLVGGAGAGRK